MVDVAVVTIVKRAHTDNEVRPAAVQTQPKWSCRSSVTSPSSIRPLPPRPENDATATSSERSRMQTPAPVDYARAHSVEEALEMMERYVPDSRLIAGGHSLIPMMRLRIAQPERVIDINDLHDLDYIRAISTADANYLAIGAMTRHRTVLASPVIGEHYAILHDAERVIADPIVRNRGTVGGSLCQADPAEDLTAVLSALRADAVIRSRNGSRTVPVRELGDGPYQTVLDDAEILTEVRIPIRPGVAAPTRRWNAGPATGRSPRSAPTWCWTATRCATSASGWLRWAPNTAAPRTPRNICAAMNCP